MNHHEITRRAFLAATTTTALAAAFPIRVNAAEVVPRKISPNEKMNIAAIGAGGKGLSDIMACRKENVVALCDVDWKQAEEAFYRNPEAKQFRDYRQMLESMPEIDACTISTPDHMHAQAAYMAMKLGKHVYVQKPLTHTIKEARLLRRTATEMKVATQMGNQGHSGRGTREMCQLIWDGQIGDVAEVHCFTDRPGGRWHREASEMVTGETAPEGMPWDVWLGPAADRPYSSLYHPAKWRAWWDFGCGSLGDMACHIMDPAWMALKLHDAPTYTVDVVEKTEHTPQTTPVSCILKFDFPARGDMGPVSLYWYDGGKLPARPAEIPADEKIGDGDNGSLFVGTKGYAATGTYGGGTKLMPKVKMDALGRIELKIPKIDGSHYNNWIDACKGGEAACSNFEYSAPFTEMVLFGNLALRTGRKMTYDTVKGEVLNDTEANTLITKSYRPGWELPV
ncbi:MAG: Gfo/Idh/MocA family oxidoreductase [Candidatus Hydrogenedentes bacterium]|nr:Gfo/Idh/MocA family oxidoreductase [Candidatus Hydrogenedentota bacterium]